LDVEEDCKGCKGCKEDSIDIIKSVLILSFSSNGNGE
jgi:hypothetical protein